MDLGLRERVYVVTGGSRGLGRAAAEALVLDGARVVLGSRNQSHASAAADELNRLAGAQQVLAVEADNGDPTAAERLVAAAHATWDRLDGALISVGGPAPGAATAVTDDQWRTAFDSVFLGAVRLVRTVAAQSGPGAAIGLVLSTSVKQPIPGLAISNGLRPGLAMTAKTLADELGPDGIRVLGLLPGRVDTERVRELDLLTDDADTTRASMSAAIPLRRYGRPDEFGRVAAFLLSPAASYITGVMVPVDGGATRSL
jgi:3-oxoacyl-[acyl-carrier protein] reductase